MTKPLGHKSYGSIGHLPGSRRGPADHGVDPGQGVIATSKARDRHDVVIVQQKLDGSNVAVANIDGRLEALGRAGHTASSSKYEQHQLFAEWVRANVGLFEWLAPGERVCGEWLAQAHGTRYRLPHVPFVAFDIMRNGHERALWGELRGRAGGVLPLPQLLSEGGPCSIERAVSLLEAAAHGAADGIEGCVWRVERQGKVDFLAKYVRPEKVDGCYLPEITGHEELWNWHPRKRVWHVPDAGDGGRAANELPAW